MKKMSGSAADVKAKKRMADILARQRRRSNKFDVITAAIPRIYLPTQVAQQGNPDARNQP
ncbi:hypothetical protein [Rhizobium esperanzae]|uniref:Uncharacterized protein n=1 Tax=Rhizobium esperanzae TaxID=1967781 RepID=A0A7W6R5D7_9HYPH|nr:hypothetical protein [Rhizobium esperanzae]MBB4236725.1 hypothetical protein [Rhizobium esperanzae]